LFPGSFWRVDKIQNDVTMETKVQKIMGWGDVRYCFAMAILFIILIFIILPHIFVRSISRRCLATDCDFFGLSRSTSCGCCSYQVSSISVWRVTCNDHFCVFHFFSILVISMAIAAILKKSTLKDTTSHGI
jgi:hypothetical protein